MARQRTARDGDELVLPTGDPVTVRAAAARFRQVSARALATAGVRGDASAELSLVWQGSAAEQADHELGTLAARGQQALPQLDAAGRALERYAEVLERAIRRTAALRREADEARVEHARLVATARAFSVDALTAAAMVAVADQRLAESLALAHRAHGRELDALMAAGARCSRALAALTPTQFGRAPLFEGLPLAAEQVRRASVRPVGHAVVRREQHWYETALDNAANAGAWAYNQTAVPLVNGAADVVRAAAEHPEDLAQLALGTGMMLLGGGAQVGGVALDSTGVGAAAGVPLHLVSAGLVSSGAITAGRGVNDLATHAAAQDSQLLRKVELRTGSQGRGGDPLPDSLRPDTAGGSWKGRVSNNGNGVVWQTPEHVAESIGTTSCRSCVRIMDATHRYEHGHVRFYNKHGQPLRPDGRPGDETNTHVPIRPDGTYDIPKGWSP